MIIRLWAKWLEASGVDTAVCLAGDPFASPEPVTFQVIAGSKVLIDAGVRLLAYSNQLTACGIPVRLVFDDRVAMGYLNRMGFFDHLAQAVDVHPERPTVSAASLYADGNNGLVEIGAIRHGVDRYELLGKLVDRIGIACADRADFAAFEDAMPTILSELIDNVYEHGGRGVSGFAAFQTYTASKKARIVVSDDGDGLMQTIRPPLELREPRFKSISDVQLLVEMFRDGLSRLDDIMRGTGLKGCAAKAIRFNAQLEVRLKNESVLLVPSGNQFVPNRAFMSSGLTDMAGTHISFVLSLV